MSGLGSANDATGRLHLPLSTAANGGKYEELYIGIGMESNDYITRSFLLEIVYVYSKTSKLKLNKE